MYGFLFQISLENENHTFLNPLTQFAGMIRV